MFEIILYQWYGGYGVIVIFIFLYLCLKGWGELEHMQFAPLNFAACNGKLEISMLIWPFFSYVSVLSLS